MGNISVWEIVLILLVLLLLFGPKRLPGIGRSLGRGMREFKDTVTDQTKELKEATIDAPRQFKAGLNPFKDGENPSDRPAEPVAAPVPAASQSAPAEPQTEPAAPAPEAPAKSET